MPPELHAPEVYAQDAERFLVEADNAGHDDDAMVALATAQVYATLAVAAAIQAAS